MIRIFFTDMRESLSGIGAILFFAAFAAVWFGLPWLIAAVAERSYADRQRAAGRPEPEGGHRLAFLPATWPGILAVLAV